MTPSGEPYPRVVRMPEASAQPPARAAQPGTAAQQAQQQGQGQASASVRGSVPTQLQLPSLEGYKFVEDPVGILAKYANSPPSLELHIHPTHYRFSNQEGIISKNNPMMAEFLSGVAEGIIPAAAIEVFRDSATRYYESCIILRLVDYRNVPATSRELNETKNEMRLPQMGAEEIKGEPGSDSTATSRGTPSSSASATSQSQGDTSMASATVSTEKEPPSYRVLLRPTPLSLWHDLLYFADATQGRVSDSIALALEGELLSMSVRKLDLRVPPRDYRRAARVEADLHRETEAARMRAEGRKRPRYVHRVTNPLPVRKLHEDLPSQTSNAYDDFMLILDDHNTAQTAANVSNQFMRLAFYEQIKKKRQRPPGLPGADFPGGTGAAVPGMAGSGPTRRTSGGMTMPGQPGSAPREFAGQPGQLNAGARFPVGMGGQGVPTQQQILEMRARQGQNQTQAQASARARMTPQQVQAQLQAQAQAQAQRQGLSQGAQQASMQQGRPMSAHQMQMLAQAQAQQAARMGQQAQAGGQRPTQQQLASQQLQMQQQRRQQLQQMGISLPMNNGQNSPMPYSPNMRQQQ